MSRSKLQDDVISTLERMGLPCSREWVTEDGLFSVDILAELPGGRRVAVEVDGPSHFTRTRPYTQLGATRLRNRLLRVRVPRMVQVPYYEWNDLKSKGEREAYLKELIGRAGGDE